jgi:transcriptional regulator with XRE-family HTH domain
MKLREAIKLMREKSGFTQSELAEKAGLTQPQLSNFENGSGSITSESLDRVFEVLGLPVYYNPSEIWDMSEKAANILIEKGVSKWETVSKLTRDEISELTGIEEIKSLRDISEDSLLIKKGIVDEKNTYEWFLVLVRVHIAAYRKHE